MNNGKRAHQSATSDPTLGAPESTDAIFAEFHTKIFDSYQDLKNIQEDISE